MKIRPVVSLMIFFLLCAVAMPAARAEEKRPDVDLVICLDSSGSMQGLIDSARQKIWDIVNGMLDARPMPNLRVALLSYGGDYQGYLPEQGYVIIESNLTTDLDTFYEKLMALHAAGGEEYVGWVVNDALEQLNWSEDANALRILFVCGNESADQAREKFDYREVCKKAAEERGIFVNAIYCGGAKDGDASGWMDVARIGGGDFTNIDQNGVVTIETPMDKELMEWNGKLNETYIYYGAEGKGAKEKQSEQDDNASGMSNQAACDRAVCKANSYYRNDSWDLVDACNNIEDFDLSKVEEKDLPENMQKMTVEERKQYVEQKNKERQEIQTKINDINKERAAYISKETAKLADKSQNALDTALRNCIRKQAATRNLKFEEEQPEKK